MQELEVLASLHADLSDLVRRAKIVRNAFPCLKTPDSLEALTMAHDVAVLGQGMISLSVKMKQAARQAADDQAKARAHKPPKKSAAQMATDMRRRGAYSVTA